MTEAQPDRRRPGGYVSQHSRQDVPRNPDGRVRFAAQSSRRTPEASQKGARATSIRARRPMLIFGGLLILIVLTFYGMRIGTDVPFLASGTTPEPEDFESRYVAHPWLAYLHMTPGVLYLLGAPLQLSERFRTRHYTVHRRLGRVLVGAVLFSVVFAMVFGIGFSWGGSPEAVATTVFGCWFLVCLLLAVRAIRRDDVINHRRWMIRAFFTGVAVGTIRIWVGLLIASGLLNFHESFAAAFWIGFVLHVLAGEWWVRTTPAKTG
jgi:uncharacterized membrane protein